MTQSHSLLLAAGLIALASAAEAVPAIGVVGDKTLVMFDTSAPAITGSLEVQGIDSLAGIDFRPADGKVYGVTGDGHLVQIDLGTGKATRISTLDAPLPAGARVVVDFNPAADKLRVMSGTTNLRVDPASGKVTKDGELAFLPEDMHKGENPNIVAGAYINSYGKPEKTALFNIDATIDGLIQQTKPNDGTLAAIGKLKIDATSYAFDVATAADGTNTAYLVGDNMLYTVDLKTGQASGVGEIAGLPGGLRDLTVLPAQ